MAMLGCGTRSTIAEMGCRQGVCSGFVPMYTGLRWEFKPGLARWEQRWMMRCERVCDGCRER